MITHSEGWVLKMQHRWQNTQNAGFPGKLLFAILWLFTPDWKEGGGRNNNSDNRNNNNFL